MINVEKMLSAIRREHDAKLEEACERALVTGTHGVAVVAESSMDLDALTAQTAYTFHVTTLVPWGEIYSFPTLSAWERFKADTPTKPE